MFWILLCILSFLLVVYEIQFRWKYRSLNRFPGPINLPFLGSVYVYYYFKSVLKTLTFVTKSYGSITKLQMGHEVGLLISDCDILEFFLRSPIFVEKSDHYQYLAPWLGKDGLFIGKRVEWQKKRKCYTPAFHFNILEEYVNIFSSHCDELMTVLHKAVDSGPVNVYPIIINFTLDVIAETTLGMKTNCQRNCNKEYLDGLHFLANMLMGRTLSVWKRFDFFYKLSPDYKKQQKYLKLVSDMSNKAIEDRKRKLSEKIRTETDNSSELNSDGRKKNTIFLDILLNNTIDDKPVSHDIITTEVNSIIFGGHDTSASAISIMLYVLASYTDVQDKIVEELKDIFGNDYDRPATMQDASEMKYMELVIKETMRFYSVVPFIARKITEDVDYKGTIIPKGTTLILFMDGVHRSAAYDRPEEFIPERFMSANYIKPYSYIPFSAGPRNCLGQKYAMLEMKVTFAKLLRHFEIESAGPNYKMELEPNVINKPVNGIYVKFKPRVL